MKCGGVGGPQTNNTEQNTKLSWNRSHAKRVGGGEKNHMKNNKNTLMSLLRFYYFSLTEKNTNKTKNTKALRYTYPSDLLTR